MLSSRDSRTKVKFVSFFILVTVCLLVKIKASDGALANEEELKSFSNLASVSSITVSSGKN